MKKSYLIILLSLILFQIVAAQTNLTNFTINPKDPTPNLDKKLDSNVKVPQELQTLTRIVFGVKATDPVSLSTLIVLLFTWSWVLVIVSSALKFMPFFKDWKLWVSSIIITILVASTGTLIEVSNFWLGLGEYFKVLENWSAALFGITISYLLIFIILTFYLKNWVDRKMRRVKLESDKRQIRKGIRVIKESAKEIE